MEKNVKLRLLDGDNVLCKISSITYYDESKEFDEGETFYINPMTGNECQTIGLVLQGWREQDEENNKNWEILIEKIKKDLDLSQKISNLDEIDYYI